MSGIIDCSLLQNAFDFLAVVMTHPVLVFQIVDPHRTEFLRDEFSIRQPDVYFWGDRAAVPADVVNSEPTDKGGCEDSRSALAGGFSACFAFSSADLRNSFNDPRVVTNSSEAGATG